MKKKIIIASINLILFASITHAADWVGFKEGVSSPTPPEIKVLKDDSSGITLEANTLGVNVEEKEVENGKWKMENGKFQLLSIPGHEYSFTQEVGKPKLPIIQVMLAIPDGVEISLSSTPTSYFLLNLPRPQTSSQNHPRRLQIYCRRILYRRRLLPTRYLVSRWS